MMINEPGHPRRALVLAAMAAAVAIVTLDTTILNIAIPTIRHDLHTDFGSLQWVIIGYSLTLGSLLIIGGRIGDLFGVRRTFIAGTVLFACGSLLASLATSTAMLATGEALIEGVGASLLFPASLATLSTTFQGPARARAFALWGGVAGASAALGPVVGGWLTSDFSWRWGFRVNVIVAPLAALAALAALPKDVRRPRRPSLDLGGAALLALGLFCLVFAVTEGPDHGWFANRGARLAIGGATVWPSAWSVSPVVPAASIAIVSVLSFLAVERRQARTHRDPIVHLALFSRRGFSSGLVTAATVVMAQAGVMFVLGIFLQATHHLSPINAGLWLLPVGLAVLVGAQLGGRGAAKADPTVVVRAGILVQLLGVVAAAAVLQTDVGWAALAGVLVLFGTGAGMASSQLTAVILAEVARERAGSASGVVTTNNALGAAIGVAILGSVLRAGTAGDVGSARWALITGVVLLAVGSAASFTVPVRRRRTQAASQPSDRQAAARQPSASGGAPRSRSIRPDASHSTM
jgi:MFS family permease